MSQDGNSAQLSEHQPLGPLNTRNGRSGQGLKSRKAVKSAKENKPAVELCEVRLNEIMDLELAGRLASTSIDQFLFFMNQVPFPISRLRNVPATNDKSQRLRNDFMTAHTRLSKDIRAALAFSTEAPDIFSPSPVRVMVMLGSIMLPKAAMLFQAPAVAKPVAVKPKAAAGPTASMRSQSSEAHELPPDSDSDCEAPEDDEDGSSPHKNGPAVPQTPMKNVTPTPSTRSPFTPFSDVVDEDLMKEAPSKGLSPRPIAPSRSFGPPLSLKPSPLSGSHVSDENQMSKARLDKRFRAAERDLTVALSNLDMFTEETELSKIHVYVQAPRTFETDGWHPRPSAARILDSLTSFPHVDAAARSKLAKMNACTVKVVTKGSEADCVTANVSRDLDDDEGFIWMEWDGKLVGVE